MVFLPIYGVAFDCARRIGKGCSGIGNRSLMQIKLARHQNVVLQVRGGTANCI